jgi:taurine dioxygenase
MTYFIERLAPHLEFGRIVRGLTSSDIAQEAVRSELRRAWIDHGLLVFCGGEIGDDFQVQLSRVFGPLERHPVREIQVEANPDLIRLNSIPGDSTWVEIDGEIGGAWLGWHSDLVYTDTINHGGLLRALKTTTHGGTTGFIDQIDAYVRLPQCLKDRIEGLSVVYQMGPLDSFPYAWKSKVRVVKLAEHARRALERIHPDFPPVAHPLVFTQAETGRKVLNLSPLFARYIEGMQNAAGDALLADLAGHILDCPSYHHQWTLDEMLLWDNWRMLHSVALAPVEEMRVMQRTTIAGDYALGRKLDADRRTLPRLDETAHRAVALK